MFYLENADNETEERAVGCYILVPCGSVLNTELFALKRPPAPSPLKQTQTGTRNLTAAVPASSGHGRPTHLWVAGLRGAGPSSSLRVRNLNTFQATHHHPARSRGGWGNPQVRQLTVQGASGLGRRNRRTRLSGPRPCAWLLGPGLRCPKFPVQRGLSEWWGPRRSHRTKPSSDGAVMRAPAVGTVRETHHCLCQWEIYFQRHKTQLSGLTEAGCVLEGSVGTEPPGQCAASLCSLEAALVSRTAAGLLTWLRNSAMNSLRNDRGRRHSPMATHARETCVPYTPGYGCKPRLGPTTGACPPLAQRLHRHPGCPRTHASERSQGLGDTKLLISSSLRNARSPARPFCRGPCWRRPWVPGVLSVLLKYGVAQTLGAWLSLQTCISFFLAGGLQGTSVHKPAISNPN